MKQLTNGCENSTQDVSKFISTNNLGHWNCGDLVDFEDTSFLLRCSNHFPPPKNESNKPLKTVLRELEQADLTFRTVISLSPRGF